MNNATVQEKLYRIGLQIQEDALENKNLVFIGLNQRGFFLAQKIYDALKIDLAIPTELMQLNINNNNADLPEALNENFEAKQIIIVDDVANTGRSFAYAMYAILPCKPASIKTVALVERSHKTYPIKINYKGMAMGTTLQNHIEVVINNNEINAFLK